MVQARLKAKTVLDTCIKAKIWPGRFHLLRASETVFHEGHRKPCRVLTEVQELGLVSQEHLDGQNYRTFRTVIGKVPRSKGQTVQMERLP